MELYLQPLNVLQKTVWVFPDETQLSPQEITFVVYYLEALITLKHLQRVGVVKHMTVEEWIKRRKTDDGHTVVGVMEHKTAAQQVAMFALDQEEEMWCDTYYTRIRPQIFRSKRCVADQDRGRFFLSLKGTPIYNPSNDIRRLHEKYELEPVTNQEARRVYETAMKTKTDSERNLVADYLTHSNITAERHYRMKLPENIVRGRHLIDFAAGDSSSQPDTRPKGTSPKHSSIESAYKRMIAEYPVTLDGKAPSMDVRVAFSDKFQRKLYERWLKAQMKLREQHVLEHFSRRLPSEARVESWIKTRGRKINVPSVSAVLEKWQPSGNVEDAISAPSVKKCVKSQK
ncbi:uncharacterized protein LOC119778462 [Cyprinodon tularosa]|uniref:uncharacterized protein LOC119778462 n=1 Tax=Cyprinodon tularosa TaxID=77115 RepID=UPI0018E244B9|nr:uncharacterized protein LOC119778462 [Cyprinodon tularosa]